MKRNSSNAYTIIEITMSNLISGWFCSTKELESAVKYWESLPDVIEVKAVATAATKKEAGEISNKILRYNKAA